ncbi:MAG: ABC transporter permease [Candidatus Omnitrophota bacterium]
MGRVEEKRSNSLFEALTEVVRYRELLLSLGTREIKARYKQTFFGIMWSIFPALATMLIFTFINKLKIIDIESGSIPYPVFAYCGLLPWTFFANALTGATTSLVSYSDIINKIYFPREIIPFSIIVSKLIDLFIGFVIFVLLALYYQVKLPVTIVALPFIVLLQVIFVAGFSLLFSMANLFYHDVSYIVTVSIPLMMFVTPVVYPIKVNSLQWYQALTIFNPMVPITDAYRDVLLFGRWPNMQALSIPICLCVVLFIAGLILFHKTEHLFAENI